jgi:hypothetical protein
VETVYFEGSNYLLLLRPFPIICSEDYKKYTEKIGVHGGNVKIIHVREVYKVSICLYFVSQGQITQLLL